MRPFMSYAEGPYAQHWLDIVGAAKHQPIFAHVNWFQRDAEDGHFLWPGYRENLRALLWLCQFKDGEVTGRQTAVGVIPTEDELGMEGLDLPQADLDRILDIDIARWREEMGHRQEHLALGRVGHQLLLGRQRRREHAGDELAERAELRAGEHPTTRGDLPPKGVPERLQLRQMTAQVTWLPSRRKLHGSGGGACRMAPLRAHATCAQMWRNCRRAEGHSRSSRVRHLTGTVGIGNLSTTSGSGLRLSSGRPLVSVSTQLQRYTVRALGRLGGHPFLADKRRRAQFGRWLGSGAHRGVEAQQAVGRAFARRSGSVRPVRPHPTEDHGVFDLTPTDDQAMLRDAAKELATNVLRPAASAADSARGIPPEVAAAGAAMGLHLVGVPTTLDGIAESGTAVTAALVLEELAHGDLGLAVALMGTASVATALSLYGTPAQQATYLPHLTAEQPMVAALATQEPQPLFDATTPRTNATREGDELVVTGTKALVLTDARVPAANLLGSADDHLDALRRSRVAWSALAVGTVRAVLDQVSGYVTERHAFGEPVAHRQSVAFMVANIAIDLDAMRLATWRAAALLDAGQDAREAVAHVRTLTSVHAPRIGSDGVQLLGGHGFVKEFDNERWYRDLRGAGMIEGVVLA